MLTAWLMAAALSAEPESLYTACRAADRTANGVVALAECQACLRADPWGQRATFCGRRVAHYRVRQDLAGGFDALSTLERARRAEASEADVSAVLSQASPEVAVEAALWLAARRQREGDLAGALEQLDAVTASVSGASAAGAQRWSVRRVELLAKLGRDADAREAAEGLDSTGAVARIDEVVRARRLAWVRWLAAGVTALWLLVVTPLAARGWRTPPRPVPLGLVPLGASLLLGLVIVWAWDAAAASAALGLAAALPVSHLLAAGALRERPSGWVRGLHVVGTLALSWWVLDATGGIDWLLP